MGIFTKGVKEVVKKQISETKPKKEISPLVKQTEDIFISSDPEIYTQMSDKAKSVLEKEFGDVPTKTEEVIGRLYSPVYSAIENMPIGKGGTKGENISAYLQKRAPNVDKAELQSFDLNLDPKRLYTREEVLNLAKEKGSPDYTIEKQRYTEYKDAQRQLVMDAEEDYVELTVEGKQEYTASPASVHLGRKSNLGHTRSSIRREAPTQLQQKIVDRPRYLLIEEIQSDLAKRRGEDGYLQSRDFSNEDGYDNAIENSFDNLINSADDYSVTVDRDLRKSIEEFIENKFAPYNVNNVDDVKKINEDETYIGLLKDEVKKITGREPVGDTVLNVANHALIDNEDFSQVARSDYYDPEIQYEASDLQQAYIDEVNGEFKDFYKTLEFVYTTKQGTPDGIKKLPVASRSDYVKRLLLANIAYAKRNGINKIVIPNPREIAKERIDHLEHALSQDENLFEAYEKARKKKGFSQDEFATDYFEKVFTPLYKDAVTKVLNSLKSETKGKIKYGTKELKYRGPYKKDAQGRLTNTRLPYKADAIEIDITDFEFNPEAQGLRFNEGGAVPMQEQMKLFNEGGLKDEGGSVDPVSGNDVPIGSTQEEVRDDIPAMLSEGEFVFPADVVRYLGLERLMQLRQEAKMGLKQMEAMGQMGNSEEATMPDDLPFNMADLIIVAGDAEEPKEMAQGGVVHMSNGGYLPKFVDQNVETAPINIESFDTTLPDPDFSNVKKYVNKEGKVRFIPFGPDGKPLYPIPVGFFPEGELPEDTPTETEEAIPTTPTGGGGGSRQIRRSPFQEAGSWNMDTSTEAGMQMWIDEANKISTFGNIGTGVVAALNPMLGAAFAGFNKMQKNKVISMLDDKIGSAQSQAQIDQLNKIKTRLTTKEGKGIIAQAISGFIKPIAEALGIGEKEEVVKKVIEVTNNDEGKSSDDIQTEVEQVSKSAFPSGRLDVDTPPQAEDRIAPAADAPYDDRTITPVRDITPPVFEPEAPPVDRSGAQTGLPRVDTRQNLISDRSGIQTGLERTIAPKADEVFDPTVQSTSVRDEGLQTKAYSGTGYKGYDQIKDGILDPLARSLTINERGTTNAYESLMNFIKQYTDDSPELSSLIAQKQRAEDSDANLDFTGTINALGTGSLPTEGDIESYLSSVSDDKPKDTSAKDRRDRRKRQERLREAGKKAQKDVDRYKASDAGKKATSTASGKAAMDRTESVVRDMQRGVTRGFAKGGLASRTK